MLGSGSPGGTFRSFQGCRDAVSAVTIGGHVGLHLEPRIRGTYGCPRRYPTVLAAVACEAACARSHYSDAALYMIAGARP